MNGLNGQWIEVFKAGKYGSQGEYSQADLDTMIANYDATQHEAPVVIGHPQDDAPAYGWVEGLKRQGDVLLAKLKQVQPKFEESVRNGSFKKRSIAFYTQPKLALRHVGFLGGDIPGVKGLADVQFRDAENGKHEQIEFKEESDEMEAKDLIQKFSEALDNAVAKIKEAMRPAAATAAFDEKALDAAVKTATAPLLAEFTELKTKMATDAAAAETARKAAETRTFSERAASAIAKLKAAGKWIPAFDKMGVSELFAELAPSTRSVEFKEGDATVKRDPLEIFVAFMEALPKIVPTGEITSAAAQKGKLIKFNEPKGNDAQVDPDSVAFAEACEARAREKKISFGDAMKQLRAESWSPTGTTAGAV